MEYELARDDGSRLNLLEYASPLHDEMGNVRGALGIFIDITAKKAAELATRASEERFRALTQLSPVGIFLTDAAGDCLMVNERWREYAGMTAEAARGKGWAGAIHPDDRERVLSRWQEAVAGSDEFADEYRFRTPGGRTTWVRSSCRVLPREDGSMGGFIGTVTDITHLKEAEELKDQFLSLISHELRTPLSTIYGSSRLLRDHFARISEPDRVELIQDLVAESERLQRIIENLLLMTRLDAGHIDLDAMDLRPVVERSVAKFRARHSDRTLNLQIEPKADTTVEANEMYVELVLENFLSNAHKYSRRDTAISVSIDAFDGGVEVRVLDEGIGITAQDEGRLFSPFYRSPEARTMTSGTGVGLAVCKRVVEAQGGVVWARSRQASGSEFGFRLNRSAKLQ